MTTERTNEAIRLIDETLNDVHDHDIPVSSLLLRCHSISKLLKSKDTQDWIMYELKGYPEPPSIKSVKETQTPLPNYRFYRSMEWDIVGINNTQSLKSMRILWKAMFGFIPHQVPFHITKPVGHLESLDRDLAVTRYIEDPKTPESYLTILGKVDRVSAQAVLTVVRARVNDFLITQKISLQFQPRLHHIFDDTYHTVSSRLSEISPQLFEEVSEILLGQGENYSEINLRKSADSCRNIIQRLTDIILTDDMIPAEITRPVESDTVGKVALITKWARTKIGRGYGTEEIHNIQGGHDFLVESFKILKRTTEKVKHKEMDKITKSEIDRVVIHLILWIANTIHLLDRAGYSWSKGLP